MASFSCLCRHICQQSSSHPGPVRRCIHRQRHWKQCCERLPGNRRGLVHCCHLPRGQRGTVQSVPWHASFLRHSLHHFCIHQRGGAAVSAEARNRRWARWAPDCQAPHILLVRAPVALVHFLLLPGGLLPHKRLLKEQSDIVNLYIYIYIHKILCIMNRGNWHLLRSLNLLMESSFKNILCTRAEVRNHHLPFPGHHRVEQGMEADASRISA